MTDETTEDTTPEPPAPITHDDVVVDESNVDELAAKHGVETADEAIAASLQNGCVGAAYDELRGIAVVLRAREG